MQFPHPQFLIDPQLVNMSTQMSSAHKHDFEDRIINKHQFCNHCKFDGGYMLHNNCAPFLCEYCGYLRNYTHHSDQHLKTQPPMKRFTCNYCEFSTEYKYNLNQRLKIPPMYIVQICWSYSKSYSILYQNSITYENLMVNFGK